MDDATSNPSDSVSSTSTTTAPAPAASTKAFAPKPRRLARGLSDLFSRKPVEVKVTPAEPAITGIRHGDGHASTQAHAANAALAMA